MKLLKNLGQIEDMKKLPLHTKAILSGYSGFVATLLLHPCDVIKLRLHSFPMLNRWTVITNMLHFEGVRLPLYTGLYTGILRQASYTCTRLSIYYLLHEYHKSYHYKLPCFPKQLTYGVNAAIVASIVECPTDIICVRMAADGLYPPFQRYTGCIHGLNKIKMQEGFFLGLWRGFIPSAVRSVIITLCQLTSFNLYYSTRQYMIEKHLNTGFKMHLLISMATSFVMAIFTLPIDTIKTRHQLESIGSLWTAVHKYQKEHRNCGYWRGFTPYYISLITTPLLHPLDVFRVRLQQHPATRGLTLLYGITRNEGLRSFYTGMTAGILRQTTCTTSRLTTYCCLHEYYKKAHGTLPGFWDKVHFGVYAGLVGAIVGCPFELILVRMAADGPLDPYRRYKGTLDAVQKICHREGVHNLWRGFFLTTARGVIVTLVQIGTYAVVNKIKYFMVEKKLATGFRINLCIAIASSFVNTVLSLPFDTIKTRYQLVNFGAIWDHYLWFRYEAGYAGLWRGFTPYFVKLTVNSVIMFYLLDQFIDHRKFKMKREF